MKIDVFIPEHFLTTENVLKINIPQLIEGTVIKARVMEVYQGKVLLKLLDESLLTASVQPGVSVKKGDVLDLKVNINRSGINNDSSMQIVLRKISSDSIAAVYEPSLIESGFEHAGIYDNSSNNINNNNNNNDSKNNDGNCNSNGENNFANMKDMKSMNDSSITVGSRNGNNISGNYVNYSNRMYNYNKAVNYTNNDKHTNTDSVNNNFSSNINNSVNINNGISNVISNVEVSNGYPIPNNHTAINYVLNIQDKTRSLLSSLIEGIINDKNLDRSNIASTVEEFGFLLRELMNGPDTNMVEKDIKTDANDMNANDMIRIAADDSEKSNAAESNRDQLEKIRTVLSKMVDLVDSGKGNHIIAKLPSNFINSLKQDLNILNTLSNNFLLVQVPIKFLTDSPSGNLYIMKKKGKNSSRQLNPVNTDNISVCLLLQLKYMGYFKALITIRNKTAVYIDMEVENEQVRGFLKENYGNFLSFLREAGYLPVDIKAKTKQPDILSNVSDNLSDENVSHNAEKVRENRANKNLYLNDLNIDVRI